MPAATAAAVAAATVADGNSVNDAGAYGKLVLVKVAVSWFGA